ncbi:MAG: DEAD/DEAH box helicase [Elusimicrobia bacterium]|nr:DEAD/DEAH box helicase [Elusimicrobiota bacterium]
MRDIKTIISGLPNLSSISYFLVKRLAESKKNILFLSSSDDSDFYDLDSYTSSIAELVPEETSFETLFWADDESLNIKTLNILDSDREKKPLIIFSSPNHVLKDIFSKEEYLKATLPFSVGSKYNRTQIISKLSEAGYSRTHFVENTGEFAVRGAIIDVFPADAERPFRLFFGDDLEFIRDFEIETQHTVDFFQKLNIPPYKIKGASEFFSSRIGHNFEIIADKGIDFGALDERIQKRCSVLISDLYDFGDKKSFGAMKNMNFASDISILAKEIKRLAEKKFYINIFCLNRGEKERLSELFEEHDVYDYCRFVIGAMAEGFTLEREKLAVITSSEIFQRHYHINRGIKKQKAKFFKLTDLKVGDFIVHEDYGIGKYMGIRAVSFEDGTDDTECLFIEYSKGDKLMVPLYEFQKVQKYVSSHARAPKLSHMDTKRWKDIKSRIKREVENLAKDILKVEAERQAIRISPMADAGHLEQEFAASFPFEETPDQLSVISDTLDDMTSPYPMNRLVVGDVGFGKTEVAMRAAARSVLNSKQAVVLAPTTILAEQHYRTFCERFREFPVNIAIISRFESKAKQKKIIEDLALGVCDIVIGTHRLLQKDIAFKNLGVLIIDEEHRFGVKDKDKLKGMSKGVHLLMLSATPIPRTLYQSLSSLKSMSVIETPPVGRLPIATNVGPFDDKTVIEAIGFEIARGGQVYYVHNRVRTINVKANFLKKLMPDLRIAIVHGQMNGELIEKHMLDFLNKKYDILLASTIIESGLDIGNVNTLIVEDAHKLGLAQLYQLRGRIGRESQKAYCYLFYPEWLKKASGGRGQATGIRYQAATGGRQQAAGNRGRDIDDVAEIDETISEIAMKRLSALEEFTELGSGFRLAMRDLEIRGSGDLLGSKQHGFINSIGLDLYVKLLNGEVDKLKGRTVGKEAEEINIDIKIPAFIPSDYINDDMERLNFYKKLLNAKLGDINGVLKELEDLSGAAPEPLKNFAEILKLRKSLSKYAVRAINQKENFIEIFFKPKSPIDITVLTKWREIFKDSIIFVPSKFGDGIRINSVDKPLKTVKEVMKVFISKR